MQKNKKNKQNILSKVLICALAVSTVTFVSLFTWKYLEVTPTPIVPPTPDPDPEPEPGPEPPTVYHSVSFETFGGTHINSIKVEHNKCIDISSINSPTKSGYDFTSWCDNEELTNPYIFSTPVEDDLTLFAKYTEFDSALTLDVTVSKGDVVSFTCLEDDVYVDWGDETSPDNKKTHAYTKDYKYTITIKGEVSEFIYTSPNKNTLTNLTFNKLTSIGEHGFRNCDGLVSVFSADYATLKNIGKQGFVGCNALEQIRIPGTVISIEDQAFYHCTNLKNVVIAENSNSSLLSIGKQAFDQCSTLADINIPSSVRNIGDEAFNECNNITSKLNIANKVDTIGVRAFNNCSKAPITISKDNSLSSIGDGAFINCDELTEFITSDKLTVINSEVFKGCDKLLTVTFKENVEEIHRSAFENCSTLKTLFDFENTKVSSISETAFKNCANLRMVQFPNQVTTICDSAFEGCTNLLNVVFKEESKLTTVADFAFKNSFLNPNVNDVVFPKSLVSIGNSAFENSGVKKVTFTGSNLESIGASAFKSSASLSVLNGLHADIKFIGENAFSGTKLFDRPVESSGCKYLDSSKIILFGVTDNTQTTYTIDSNCSIIYEGSFKDCTNLTEITIPDNVKTIGAHAFDGCINLTTINISGSSKLTHIDDYAFYSCGELTAINIPDTVTTIGDHVFDQCKKLVTVNISGNSQLSSIGSYAFYECDEFVGFNIPKAVTAFNDYSFYNCRKIIDTINIHKDVTRIGNCAFEWCKKLNFTVEEENSKLTEIGEHAFAFTAVTDFVIPKSVKIFGKSAFAYSSLQNIEYYDNIKIIPESCFVNCGFTSFHILSSIQDIQKSAFLDNTKLVSFTFAEDARISVLREWLFQRSIFETIKLPKSLKSIEGCAISSCNQLTTVDLTNFTTPDSIPIVLTGDWRDNPFFQCGSITTLIVYNDEMKTAFSTDPGWSHWFSEDKFVVYQPEM